MKNTRGKVLLLVKVQIERNFIKSNTPLCVFFTFSKLYKWYQIAQTITESYGCLFLIICCQTPVNIFNVRKAGHFPRQVWLSNGLRYRFQGIRARKNEPKNVFSMFPPCICYVKTTWNSLRILQKLIFLQDTKTCFPKGIEYQISLDFQSPTLPQSILMFLLSFDIWYFQGKFSRDYLRN